MALTTAPDPMTRKVLVGPLSATATSSARWDSLRVARIPERRITC